MGGMLAAAAPVGPRGYDYRRYFWKCLIISRATARRKQAALRYGYRRHGRGGARL